MKIHGLLTEALIEPNLPVTGKDAVLEHIVKLAIPCIKADCPAEVEQILEALRDREAVTSTGIGNGIAIPHAKVEGLHKIILAFARSSGGVDFQSLDDGPVFLIFMVIAPPGSVSDYLKLLAAISAFLKKSKNREALRKATTKADIIAAIKAAEA